MRNQRDCHMGAMVLCSFCVCYRNGFLLSLAPVSVKRLIGPVAAAAVEVTAGSVRADQGSLVLVAREDPPSTMILAALLLKCLEEHSNQLEVIHQSPNILHPQDV